MPSVFTLSLTFFLIINSVGHIPAIDSILKNFSWQERLYILFREMLFALLIMCAFTFLDDLLFDLLKISTISAQITAGLILFLAAIPTLFSYHPLNEEKKLPYKPFIIPIAVPFIAGPATVAIVMLSSHLSNNSPQVLLAVFLAWITSFLVLLFGKFWIKILGKPLIYAIEKLLSIILVLIAIQRILNGITELISSLP